MFEVVNSISIFSSWVKLYFKILRFGVYVWVFIDDVVYSG